MRGPRLAQFIASITVVTVACAMLAAGSCSKRSERLQHRTFRTPEDAVRALNGAVAKGNLGEVMAIFGPDGRELVDSSDPVTARQSREVYAAAAKQGWRLVDQGPRKELIVGNEGWPFPVPLVKVATGWRFDTEAGKEEVLRRRIGRNELKAIDVCNTYVAAQRRYAREAHDGKASGLYARTFRSDPERQNGLYWAAARGQPRSPLGDLLPSAAVEHARARASQQQRAPFHGYFFRILTAQGSAARGGAKDYVVNGELSGGFALVAWPAQYDRTGIMTFIVNHDRIVHEKDLGFRTDAAANAMTRYDPDDSWSVVR